MKAMSQKKEIEFLKWKRIFAKFATLNKIRNGLEMEKKKNHDSVDRDNTEKKQ